MGRPTIIDYFRNITFIAFIIGIIAAEGGNIKGVLLVLPYFLMELFAILHRVLRFRTKQIDDAGSERQLRFVGYYQPRHVLDLKFVAFFRRIFFVLTIGVIVKYFISHDKTYLWIPALFVTLIIITFIKVWYIFGTSWPGSYSVFTLFGKQIGLDFVYPVNCFKGVKEHNAGAVFGLISSILVMLVTVILVLYL